MQKKRCAKLFLGGIVGDGKEKEREMEEGKNIWVKKKKGLVIKQ